MTQIDDAPGELLGHVVEKMGEMGAKNVQLLPSLGKKGRPSYVLLVDINAEDEPDFAALLVGDLGVWGYRVLESQHKHFDIRRYRTQLQLTWAGGEVTFPLRIKRILNDGVFMRAKAEHDDLVAIAEQIKDHLPVSLAVLKAAIETAVGSEDPGETLVVDLASWQSSER
ncbi:nickel insertion protein [Rhizobium sp. CCGE532]|uniref:nickel insertion protein n=1 Tax=Rhizobium sp. CCGE532 TaxID=2364272 RepID=UPI001FE07847|nr:nickel insertion protein [Rhizobium sp. CCGE532]